MKFRELSTNEIRRLADELTKEINKRKEIITQEFIKHGYISSSERLTYENINMNDLEEKLLLVLYNYHINGKYQINQGDKNKIEKICLAAMCQFLKSEYHIRSYTKDYERLTNLKVDARLYNILENAFEKENILPKNWENMKGFRYKDTLINETGIPKYLANDLISLFKVYWKNLRQFEFQYVYENIDTILSKNYIWDIKEAKLLKENYTKLNEYPQKVNKSIKQLCDVCTLLEEGNYYEEDLSKDQIVKAINKVLKFDIFAILPRRESLKRLYIQILSKTSVNKFKHILQNIPLNTKIRIPDRNEKILSQYNDIQLGIHNINSPIYRIYTVLPHTSLSINKLLEFKYDQYIEGKNSYIGYRSKQKFNVKLGKYKRQESYPLYDSFRLKGYYWYGKVQNAVPVIINNKTYEPNEFVDYNPIFKYYYNDSLNSYSYNLILNGFKVYLPAYSNEKLAIKCNYSDDVKYISIDKDGYVENRRFIFKINKRIEKNQINIEIYHYNDNEYDILYKENIQDLNDINLYIYNLEKNKYNKTNFEYNLKHRNWKFNDKVIFHIEQHSTYKNKIVTNIKNAVNDVEVLANYNEKYSQFILEDISFTKNNGLFICDEKLKTKFSIKNEDFAKINLKFMYNHENIFEEDIVILSNIRINLDSPIYVEGDLINIEVKYNDKIFKVQETIQTYRFKESIVPRLISVSIFIEELDTYFTQYISPNVLGFVLRDRYNHDILNINSIHFDNMDRYLLEAQTSIDEDIKVCINNENIDIEDKKTIDLSKYKDKFRFEKNKICIKQLDKEVVFIIFRDVKDTNFSNVDKDLEWYEIY